jgi:hypothetical protein
MSYTPIDTIVKSTLLRRGYSMHWYLLFTKYATDCVRELSYHTFRFIKTEVIQADNFGQVPYPADYEKWLRVGMINGQHVKPLVQAHGFNRQLLTDESGLPVPYPLDAQRQYEGPYSWMGAWINNTNEFNENTGGLFGYGAGTELDLFQDIPERNCIQVSQQLAGSYIVVDYLPTVNNPDNLCKVPADAQATIEQYIIWQLKEHGRHYSKQEAKDEERMYYGQLRLLRARMKPLTTEDYLRIFRREYHSSLKS